MCGDGQCISKDWACDGIDDCNNGTDEEEEFCATCPFQFYCSNDRCTDLENVCNGRNDCRDNSDETQICDIGKNKISWKVEFQNACCDKSQ
jgi:low density lipoprotein-related protein 2